MRDIIQCPHCGNRIIPMAGNQCPSCLKNVLDLVKIKKTDQMYKIYGVIGRMYKSGCPRQEIVQSCMNAGFSSQLIEEAIVEYKNKEESRLFGLVVIGFWSGIGFLLMVLTVTFVTLIFIHITGIGIFADGAMAVGLINMMTSIYLNRRMIRSFGK